MDNYILTQDKQKCFTELEIDLVGDIHRIIKYFNDNYVAYDNSAIPIIVKNTPLEYKKEIDALLEHTIKRISLKVNNSYRSIPGELTLDYSRFNVNKIYRVLRAFNIYDPQSHTKDSEYIRIGGYDGHYLFRKRKETLTTTTYSMTYYDNRDNIISNVSITVDNTIKVYYTGIIENLLMYNIFLFKFNKKNLGNMYNINIDVSDPVRIVIVYELKYDRCIGKYIENFDRSKNGRYRLNTVMCTLGGNGKIIYNKYVGKNTTCNRPVSGARSLNLF